MSGSNGYASMVWNRKKKKRATTKGKRPRGKRRRLDNYETPPRNTFQLATVVLLKGPILEPACGSGRMVRALRTAFARKPPHGFKWRVPKMEVVGMDLKDGPQFDFLKRTKKWKGDIVTNPPYGKGMSDAFVYKALELADGRVAMLVELKFLTGDKRAKKLFMKCAPELVIIIPERIYFIAGAKPIPAQFYNHCWIVWPRRSVRERGGYDTKMIWADPKEAFEGLQRLTK